MICATAIVYGSILMTANDRHYIFFIYVPTVTPSPSSKTCAMIAQHGMILKAKDRSGFRRLADLSTLVLMLPSSIAVGLFFGYLLDKLLGTRPWMLFVFLLLGTASGFYSLLRGLQRYTKDETDDGSSDRP
jgi:ATP synthase protein I